MRSSTIFSFSKTTGVSIPKGAIMSVLDPYNQIQHMSFNSKRCDYEEESYCQTAKQLMQFQFQKVRL